MTRYDARRASRTPALDLLACAVGAGDGVVWAAGCPYVDRLSTGAGGSAAHRGARSYPVPTTPTAGTIRFPFRDIAVGEGSLWLLGDAIDRRVYRSTPDRHVLATIALPFAPRSIAAGEGGVWVTAPLDDVVLGSTRRRHGSADDPGRPRGERHRVGRGAVWVTSASTGR